MVVILTNTICSVFGTILSSLHETGKSVQCPHCNHFDSKVTDSRTTDTGVRRRRECILCGIRFTTYERVQSAALLVAKSDGRREEFNRDKLTSGIIKACTKRPVPYSQIESMVADIEANLHNLGSSEVLSDKLGHMVMEHLRGLDRVAYVRFASVYRDFQDIESFEEVVKDLREGTEDEQLSFMENPPASSRAGRRQTRRLTRAPVISATEGLEA